MFDPTSHPHPEVLTPIQIHKAPRDPGPRLYGALHAALNKVKVRKVKDDKTKKVILVYEVPDHLKYAFATPKDQAGSRYLIDLRNEHTWTIRQILHCAEPECYNNPYAAKAIWDLYLPPLELRNQAELEKLNGHPRAAVETDLRFLGKVGQVILEMEGLHVDHGVYFTEQQIGPLRCYLSLTGLLDWAHVTEEMREKWLGVLPFGIQPAVAIYNLICALENLVDQAKETTRLTQRTDINRTELDASHARWLWLRSDRSVDEPRKAAFEYQLQQEVFFTGPVIHPLPHKVAQDEHYSKENLEALFEYTRQAEHILSELEAPHRVVYDFDREIGQSLVESLKRLYLINLDHVLHPIHSGSPSGQELHNTEIHRSDPRYCVLDIMPRWWGIPLLVSRFIAVLGLNVPDLDEENGLDRPIEAALSEATASLAQNQHNELPDLTLMDIDTTAPVPALLNLGKGLEEPAQPNTITPSTARQSTVTRVERINEWTKEDWAWYKGDDLLADFWK